MTTTLVLALDTATAFTALAVGIVDRTAGHAKLLAAATHDDRTAPASGLLARRILSLLTAVDVTPAQIGAIACGIGPGTFTGVRVALATAKGLAFARACPLFAVNTLAAVAATPIADPHAHPDRFAVLDARRGEVYAARFTVTADGLRITMADRCTALTSIVAELSATDAPVFIGPESVLEQPVLATRPIHATPGVTGEGLWVAAADVVLHAAPADLDLQDAVYLRPSYAEQAVHKPKRPAFHSPFV